MTRADPDRPVYVLRLKPAPGTDHVKMLRMALKTLLRRFGLRCVSVEQEGGGLEK